MRDVTTPFVIPQHYTDNGNGTITDNLTSLVWQKVLLLDTITWEQSLSFADTLTLAGYTDWRLPNIKELQSISDLTVTNPSMSSIFTVGTGAKSFWSSTTQLNNAPNAWYLNTQNGITTYISKTRKLYSLCVRGNTQVSLGITEVINPTLKSLAFPNPARNSVTITYNFHDAKSVRLTIKNMLGIKVFEENIPDCKDGTNQQEWQTEQIPQGVYFYSVDAVINDLTTQKCGGTILLLK